MRSLYAKMTKIRSVWVWIGLASLSFVYLGVSGLSGMVLPWQGAADSRAHLDYIYEVSQGEMPEAYGFSYAPIWSGKLKDHENTFHLTAAHPPLYYWLMSLPTKGLLEDGEWHTAVMVIRTINSIFGLLTLLSVAYFAWRLGGRHRELLTVTAPLAVLATPYMTISSDVYNEPIVVWMSVLALGISFLAVKNGPTKKLVALLALVSAVGMLSKATYLAPMIIAVGLLMVAYVVHRPTKESYVRASLKALLAASVIAVSVAVSSGWFYIDNYNQSGSWFRSVPKWPVPGREYKSLQDNLTNPDFYNVVPGSLLGGRDWLPPNDYNRDISLVISLVIIGAILYGVISRRDRAKEFVMRSKYFWIVAGSAALVVLLYAQQLQHAIGWGNINPRYLLNGMLVFGFIVGIGILSVRKSVSWLAAGLLAGILACGAILNNIWLVEKMYKMQFAAELTVLDKARHMATQNGLDPALIYVSLAIVVVGLAVYWLSLFCISKKPGEKGVVYE